MKLKNKYNSYDNPSSSMRINCSQLKNLLLVTEYVMKDENISHSLKHFAKELNERTNKYCEQHFTKVYEEIDYLRKTSLERYFN